MSKVMIHVNRHHIAANTKDGGDRPVYTVKHAGKTQYAQGVEIRGGVVRLVDPRVTKPLSCGARAWIEVTGNADVALIEACTFAEAKRR